MATRRRRIRKMYKEDALGERWLANMDSNHD